MRAAKGASTAAGSSASQSPAMNASPKPIRPWAPSRRKNASLRTRIRGASGPPPPMMRPSGRLDAQHQARDHAEEEAAGDGGVHRPVPGRRRELLPRARGPRLPVVERQCFASSLASHSFLRPGPADGEPRAVGATTTGCPAVGSTRSPVGRPAGDATTPARNDGALRSSIPASGGPEDSSCPAPQRDLDAELFGRPRVGERHLVAPVDREERRHVERLVGLRLDRRRRDGAR